jgi:hypothetical protein
VAQRHVQIWSLSANKQEFDRFKGLLDGSLQSGISPAILQEGLLFHSQKALQYAHSVVLVHDGCDIRKPYSNALDSLDKVRDLSGDVISGYRSFDSIAIDLASKQLHLLGCKVIKQGENSHKVGLEQIVYFHEALKVQNPNVVIHHVLDRGFDDSDYFEKLSDLVDSRLVIRLKNWRNSDVQGVGEQGEELRLKWGQKTLANSFTRTYAKFGWGEKVHLQAQAHFSYETIVLKGRQYDLLKVEMRTRKGEKIFREPMLLLTNHLLTGEAMGLYVFHLYLKRSKIEGVFKFLKEHLGWENFQVRDFQSIENVIVLCYFIGGYFYEMEDELTKNPLIQEICLLGYGKGKNTKVYFLRGLAKLAAWEEIQSLIDQGKMSKEQVLELLKYYKME